MLKVTKLLFAAAAALGMSSALAGYAYPSPPAGYSRVGDAWTYRAANASEWLGSTVRTNATLNVGGRAVTIPAALRMAANAPRFAAASIFTPAGYALAAASVLGPIAYDLWNQHKVRWNEDAEQWERETKTTTFYWWVYSQDPAYRRLTPEAACAARGFGYQEEAGGWGPIRRCTQVVNGETVSAGYAPNYATGDEVTSMKPIDLDEFITRTYPYIDPEDVPDLVPGKAIPVEYPDINPSPDPVPQPRPMRIPLGDPVRKPNPAYDPVTNPSAPPYIWERPYVVINPSPRPDTPWRVDTQPETIVAPDPSKLPDNPGDPLTDGDPDTNPAPNPGPLPDISSPPDPSQSPQPQEIITCGLPSTPPCRIDEEGTPGTEVAKFDDAESEIERFKGGLLESIQSKLDEITHEWTWTFALPTGCSALQFDTQVGPVVQIDMCEWQPMIHDIMSMIWAAAGVFGAMMIFLRSNG